MQKSSALTDNTTDEHATQGLIVDYIDFSAKLLSAIEFSCFSTSRVTVKASRQRNTYRQAHSISRSPEDKQFADPCVWCRLMAEPEAISEVMDCSSRH